MSTTTQILARSTTDVAMTVTRAHARATVSSSPTRLGRPWLPRLAAVLAGGLASALLLQPATAAESAAAREEFVPQVGQPGKDVVWVPTPEALVDTMLNLADLKPGEYLVDLGSGDGRTVIAAAKRGARARGIEYNPNMVELAKRNAEREGVSDRATFEQGDLFQKDFSDADVITLFLLPSLNERLRPVLLEMRPGVRVVSNSFGMGNWEPDRRVSIDGSECRSWCSALLWIVPARVQGTWEIDGKPLILEQEFQKISGTLDGKPLEGRLQGAQIEFSVDDVQYKGTVDGKAMRGERSGGQSGSWQAVARTGS